MAACAWADVMAWRVWDPSPVARWWQPCTLAPCTAQYKVQHRMVLGVTAEQLDRGCPGLTWGAEYGARVVEALPGPLGTSTV